MSWEDLKKELSEEVKFTIKQLDMLNDTQKEEVLEDFKKYWIEEKKKKVEERKLYTDKYGGTIVLLQFPKKSVLKKSVRIASEPKLSKNKAWNWFGIQMPLFNNAIITIFVTTKNIENLWEPEDKTIYYIVRGTMDEKYKWLNDSEYHRPLNKFLKEAQEKYPDQEINTIEDVPKGTMDKVKYTFNIVQNLKVI